MGIRGWRCEESGGMVVQVTGTTTAVALIVVESVNVNCDSNRVRIVLKLLVLERFGLVRR